MRFLILTLAVCAVANAQDYYQLYQQPIGQQWPQQNQQPWTGGSNQWMGGGRALQSWGSNQNSQEWSGPRNNQNSQEFSGQRTSQEVPQWNSGQVNQGWVSPQVNQPWAAPQVSHNEAPQLYYYNSPGARQQFGSMSQERKAIVRVQGPIVNGNVTFTQLEENGPVRVQGTVLGLATGRYGFHVHEKGDLTGGCLSSGGHFNPHKQDHGAPQDHVRHVGDLGNIESRDGVARIDLEDHLLSLSGEHNIIGRALVIHSAEDDLGRTSHPDSKKTGNAGSRVSCGVIGILKMPNSGIELKPSSIVMVSAILLAIAQIL